MVNQAEQKGQRQRIRKNLSAVSRGARTPRASCPPEAMPHIGNEALAANVVFDGTRRQQDVIALLRSTLPENEVLCEKLAKLAETTHLFNHISPSRDRGAESELHSIQHAGYKHTAQKFRVHAYGFEARPHAAAGDSAVWAGNHSHGRVL